jgi:hypothetical protein
MSLQNTNTNINHVICNFSFNEERDATLKMVEVPAKTEQMDDDIDLNVDMIIELNKKGLDSLNLENLDNTKIVIGNIISTIFEYPGLKSLMKNIAENNISFDIDASRKIYNSNPNSLLIISQISEDKERGNGKFFDVFTRIDQKTIISGMPKTIDEFLEEKSKNNTVSVASTGTACSDLLMVDCETDCETKFEQNLPAPAIELHAFFIKTIKLANTTIAFLETSPAKEKITSLFISIPGKDGTYKSFMRILFILLALNKVVDEKAKIDKEGKFTLFFHCDNAHVPFLNILLELASNYKHQLV